MPFNGLSWRVGAGIYKELAASACDIFFLIKMNSGYIENFDQYRWLVKRVRGNK
jgi:hypothetical protein